MQKSMERLKTPNYALYVCIVLSCSGIMFGYDNSVIAGAIGSMIVHFSLNPATTGWVVSSVTVGAIVGSLFAGALADTLGRKKVLLLAALCFAIGSIGQGISDSISMLVTLRILGGMGIGLTNTVSPLYIAEMAPARIRGALASAYQLLVVIGLTLVFFVNAYIATLGNGTWNATIGWRIMLCLGATPAILIFIFALSVPESPRWLRFKGKKEQAKTVLEKIRQPEEVDEELNAIDNSIESAKQKEAAPLSMIFKPGVRKIVGIGFMLALFQYITGIDGILYYASIIFEEAGAGAQTALYNTIIIGITLTAFTLVAIFTVDRFGRKILLLSGTIVMAISLGIIAFLFFSHNTSVWLILGLILANVAGFSVGMGSVMWVVLSEIFPGKIRGLAISIAMAAFWIANYLVAQFLPVIAATMGMGMVFLIFSILAICAVLFIGKYVPETKGKSLEEIEKFLLKE